MAAPQVPAARHDRPPQRRGGGRPATLLEAAERRAGESAARWIMGPFADRGCRLQAPAASAGAAERLSRGRGATRGLVASVPIRPRTAALATSAVVGKWALLPPLSGSTLGPRAPGPALGAGLDVVALGTVEYTPEVQGSERHRPAMHLVGRTVGAPTGRGLGRRRPSCRSPDVPAARAGAQEGAQSMAAAGLCGLFSGQELWPVTCRSLACLVQPGARRAPLSPRPVSLLGWGTGAPLQQAHPPIRPGFASRSLWTQALHPQKALKPTVGDQNVPTPSGIRWGSDGPCDSSGCGPQRQTERGELWPGFNSNTESGPGADGVPETPLGSPLALRRPLGSPLASLRSHRQVRSRLGSPASPAAAPNLPTQQLCLGRTGLDLAPPQQPSEAVLSLSVFVSGFKEESVTEQKMINLFRLKCLSGFLYFCC